MYGDDQHRCEVGTSDMDSLRYDLERKIEDLTQQVSQLENRIRSLQEEIANLWSALQEGK